LTDDDLLVRLAAVHREQSGFDERMALAADFPAREPQRTFLYEQIAALNPGITQTFLAALISLRYPADVERLRMPICFIAGGRDRLFPLDLIRSVRAKLPDAQLQIVPEAGHSAYFECPQEFNGLLMHFLQRYHL
jgi:pimeloyl-ACP methyl ester carboxylesterase